MLQQPDQRLQQGPRLRVHRDPGRLPQQRRAVDVVVAGRRPHRLLRAHREDEDAHPPERRQREDRAPHRAQDRRHAGVARHQPRRQGSRLLRPRRRDRRHLHRQSRERRGPQRHQRRLRRLRADLDARRQVADLPRARQRQRQAVPPRSRERPEDAGHLRHARRRRGAVHRRRHAGVPVDRGRPEPADRARGRAQRQHLQHLDAQPEDEGAAPVHRHADRQHLAGRPARHQAGARRLRHLLQGRVRHPRADARRAAAHGGVERLRRRRGRSADRLPAADEPHPRRRQQAQEGHVREAVPRGPAAGRASA